MNISNIFRVYEKEKRVATGMPGLWRKASGTVIRHVDPHGGKGMISWSSLSEATAVEEIRRQIEFFSGLNKSFDWKVYGTDQPAELKEHLRAWGFTEEPEESHGRTNASIPIKTLLNPYTAINPKLSMFLAPRCSLGRNGKFSVVARRLAGSPSEVETPARRKPPSFVSTKPLMSSALFPP